MRVPDQPRLVLKSSYAKGKIKYATLSHRWGKNNMPKLLRHNKKQLLRNIDPDSLPLVFRDAI